MTGLIRGNRFTLAADTLAFQVAIRKSCINGTFRFFCEKPEFLIPFADSSVVRDSFFPAAPRRIVTIPSTPPSQGISSSLSCN